MFIYDMLYGDIGSSTYEVTDELRGADILEAACPSIG